MKRWIARALIAFVRLYQVSLSSLWPGVCRFQPSCSHYAISALTHHGPWHGIWLTAKRLAKCHPLGGAGYDPVPASHRRKRNG